MAEKNNISQNFLTLLDGLEQKNYSDRSSSCSKISINSEKERYEGNNKIENNEDDKRFRRANDKQSGRGNRRGGYKRGIGHDRESKDESEDGRKQKTCKSIDREHWGRGKEGERGNNMIRNKYHKQNTLGSFNKSSENCEATSSQFSCERSLNKTKNVGRMGYRALESLLNCEPHNLLTTLASPKSGFQELLNDRPLKPDLIMLIVSVLRIVSESEIQQLKMQILSESFTPEFLDEIKKYTTLTCIEDNPERIKAIEVFFSNISTLLEAVVSLFPSMMNEKLKTVMVALTLAMKNAKDMQGINVTDDLFARVQNMTEQINSYMDYKIKRDRERKTNGKDILAPNDFRDLPLVPTKDDFLHEKAFLRQNIVKGSFKDVEQYLDIQFRLLREDFIAPIRTGIYEYLESLSAPHLRRKYSNVRIYPKVQFKSSFKIRDVFGFEINFDCDNKQPRNVNWEFNKSFMIGSLLLFSDDNFQTFYLATVAERDLKQLQKKLLFVTFVPGTCAPDHIFEPSSYFVMAESEVYYEAYRHVLSALKGMNDKNFPMKQYIIDADTHCFPPEYLIDDPVYEIHGYRVNILDENNWPTAEQLSLNASQHQAFKSALTNDFVVIQGPPGTGKTFLALKITEVLLKNNVAAGSPIVVICYTNHALDQFLEGILKYTNSLIRIGGQSQNEALADYNIDKIRKEKKLAQTFHLSALYKNTISEKFELQDYLQGVENKINKLNTYEGILELDVLKSFVVHHHYNELKDQEVEWLLCHDSFEFHSQEETQEAPQNSEQERKMFENINDFIEQEFEEEMDDDENDQRLADMIEEDFFDEDFIGRESYSSNLLYSFDIDSISGNIAEEYCKLAECKLPVESAERFYFEQDTVSHIQEMSWKIDFIKEQFLKFKNFKFNPEKFEMLQNTASVWEIALLDRWEYYFSWIYLYSCQLKKTMQYLTERYQQILLKIYELKQLDDLAFVKDAAVIGLTTSGAARRRVLIENLDTKIVIVEEAAEVLEAHIVTSLAKGVEHVILIGDHKQLKPNPAVFELAKKYNMDVSLFERMLNNGLGFSVLGVQHRMRPEIASLITPHIYPTLANHPSTLDRPKIMGIDKFVFFLTHNKPEDQLPDSASRQNKFEADFLISLCKYLMLQGYSPEEITILATYTGQVWYMRKEKRRLSSQNPEWRKVRITPVDNFQGEENRIILLSLVRSNKEAKIGFLNKENRVCVALSRAKDGLYIVGNMDNLTANSSCWIKVKQQLDQINAVGHSLTLRCERHPAQLTQVSEAKDFTAVPEGGCLLPCEFQLDCGHVCPRICHIIDSDHGFYSCQKPCERSVCGVEGHRCPLMCGQQCKPCVVIVQKQLPCSHKAMLKCHVEPASVSCQELVPATLPDCGHLVHKPCYQPVEQSSCSHSCEFRLSCGHACVRKCHVTDDPDHIKYHCRKDCTKVNAGCRHNHPCPKRCYEECGNCCVLVKTKLACGHTELIPCSDDGSTFQCKKPCTRIMDCGHKCLNECWLPCEPKRCQAQVDKVGSCGHTLKKVKCNLPADSVRCSEKCSRKLPCGHNCNEKCWKNCASVVCQEAVQVKEQPACGHPSFLIPCHLNKLEVNPGSDELLQLCKAPCDDQLLCGHKCSGVCGRCLQGRLHVPCNQICNKRLLCGHQCKAMCSELCPPCKANKCFNQCTHKICTKTHSCGKPCDPCNNRCIWQCPHYRCTKQCGEVCDRPVCKEPCEFQLKCGHLCRGYCGEPHLPLCLICADSPIIAEHPNARFVVLEDCNHIIEAGQLDELVIGATRGSVVQMLLCPQCSTPIVKTMYCRSIFIQFQEQLSKLCKVVNEEVVRFRNMRSRHISLLSSNPTSSNALNKLLSECCYVNRGNPQLELPCLLLSCLLQPLATRCNQLRADARRVTLRLQPALGPRILSDPEEQRLRLRLEYLASALRPRLRNISYADIQQIELEVARVLRAVTAQNLLNLWYDPSKFSWEKDKNIMAVHNLEPLPRISCTLRSRDAARRWYKCDKNHFYVSEDGEACSTCREYEEERQRQAEQQLKKNQQNVSHQSRFTDELNEVLTRQMPVTNHQGFRGRWGGKRGRGNHRGRQRPRK